MPFKISASVPITGYRAGAADRAPRWVDGVTFIRDDATAELAYYQRRGDDYTVEPVAVVDQQWATDVAELRARSQHGGETRPDELLDAGTRNDRARAADVTPDQVAAVVASIEGA